MAGRKEWGNIKRKAAKAVELSDTGSDGDMCVLEYIKKKHFVPDSDEDMCMLEYIKKKQTCLPVKPQVKLKAERLGIRKLENNGKVSVESSIRGDIMKRGAPVANEGSSTFPKVVPEVSANDFQVCPPPLKATAGRKILVNNKRRAARAVELSDTDSDEDMCLLERLKKNQTCLPVKSQVNVRVERLGITKLKNNVKVSGVDSSDMERSDPVVKEGSSTFPTVMPEVPANDLQVSPPQTPFLHTTVVDGSGSTTYKCFVTDLGDSDAGNNVREDHRVRPEVYYVVERFTCEEGNSGFKEVGYISNEVIPRVIKRSSILSTAVVQQSANERPVCPPQSLEHLSIVVNKDGTTAERVGISNMDCDEEDHVVGGSFSEDVTLSTYSPVLPHIPAIQQTTCPPTSNSSVVPIVKRARVGNTDYINAGVVEIAESGEECDVITRGVPLEEQPSVSTKEWPTSIGAQGSIVGIASGRNTGNVIEISIDSDKEEEDPTIRNESVGGKQQTDSLELQQCQTISNSTQVVLVDRARSENTAYNNSEVLEISNMDRREECEVMARDIPLEKQPPVQLSGVEWPTPNSTQCSTVRVDSGSFPASAGKISLVGTDEEEKDLPNGIEFVAERQQVPVELQQRPTISSNKQFVTVPLTSIEMMTNAVNNGAEFLALELNANNHGDLRIESQFLEEFYSVQHIFKCIFCQKVCPDWTNMQVHLQFHLRKKTLQCKICGNLYSFRGELHRHIVNHVYVEFICDFCGNKFQSADAFKTHLFTHCVNGHWLCSSCSQVFPTLSSLEFHFKQMHETNFYCKICGGKVDSFDKLKEHFISHFKYRLFKCKLCGKEFPSQFFLKFHLEKSHNLHFWNCPCDDCIKKNKEKKNKGKLEKYTCTKCMMEFNHPIKFNMHLNVHRVGPYKCDLCEKAYKNIYNLIAHKKEHENSKSKTEFDELIDENNDINSLINDLTMFSWENSRWNCKTCDKLFSLYLRIMNHMKVHQSEKLSKCEICVKKIRWKSDLKDHIAHHKSNAPAAFNKSSDSLTRELSKSSQEVAPLKCKFCKMCFLQECDIRTHIQQNHSESEFQGEIMQDSNLNNEMDNDEGGYSLDGDNSGKGCPFQLGAEKGETWIKHEEMDIIPSDDESYGNVKLEMKLEEYLL